MYTADQLTRHNVTMCMSAPLVFINSQTLYYLERRFLDLRKNVSIDVNFDNVQSVVNEQFFWYSNSRRQIQGDREKRNE